MTPFFFPEFGDCFFEIVFTIVESSTSSFLRQFFQRFEDQKFHRCLGPLIIQKQVVCDSSFVHSSPRRFAPKVIGGSFRFPPLKSRLEAELLPPTEFVVT